MPIDPLSLALAIAGGIWGFVADRISVRWPEHEEEGRRGIDWRTVVVVVGGAIALASVPGRFHEPLPLLVFGGYTVALILLLATDLDQRLLPDIVTLPAIPLALVYTLSGLNPLVPGSDLPLTLGIAIGIPLVLALLAIPFGDGAIGMGDLKLLISAGLLAGGLRIFTGVVWGAFLGGLVIGLLLLSRRVTLRSYVPFGPFLIAGTLWAILAAP